MLQKLSTAIIFTALLSAGITGKVSAVSLTESVDAGEFLVNAGQSNSQPAGTPLTGINGNLGDGDNIDLYQIYLPSGTFTATGSSGQDTQLFLFNDSGLGVIGGNDPNSPDFNPSISTNISTAGNYYLGISLVGFNPQSASGPIFAIDPTTNGVQDPSIPGSGFSSSLNGWSTGFSPAQEGYTISVSGAQFVGGNAAAVPFDFNPTFGVTILGLWAGWKYLRNRKKS
ncbi:MAG TPA: hypothetical protein DCZ55_23700 [Cyanobacteria bacterium UBA11371]|nr:hypothetical protein [Cyanobacteria bacterium UBA11371]